MWMTHYNPWNKNTIYGCEEHSVYHGCKQYNIWL